MISTPINDPEEANSSQPKKVEEEVIPPVDHGFGEVNIENQSQDPAQEALVPDPLTETQPQQLHLATQAKEEQESLTEIEVNLPQATMVDEDVIPSVEPGFNEVNFDQQSVIPQDLVPDPLTETQPQQLDMEHLATQALEEKDKIIATEANSSKKGNKVPIVDKLVDKQKKIKHLFANDSEPPKWLIRLCWGILFPGFCFLSGYLLFALVNHKDLSLFGYDPSIEGRHQVYSLNIPENVRFANEAVPLKDIDIYERFDRELTLNVYWQANTLLMIKRSARWFPMIQQTLKQNNVPQDFKYVAAIESLFENKVSPAGAAGYWQLMEGAAREYGLEITDEVDERYHPQKATVAACKYFKQAKSNFGSWTSALASYNIGMGGLQRSMNSQKMNNYYDLLINQETGRYVFRLLSFKQIMENPETYGFYVDRKHLYKPYRLRHVKVTSTIPDLTAWSIGQKINYKILKQYNPWLRKNSLTVASGKVYHIAIPKDQVDLAEQEDEPLMQSDTLLSDSAMSDKFQENDPNLVDATPIQGNYTSTPEVKVPDNSVTKATDKSVVNQQVQASPEVIIHTVKNGESLARIAKKYKVKIIDIIILNDLDIDKPLKLGRQIRIK